VFQAESQEDQTCLSVFGKEM